MTALYLDTSAVVRRYDITESDAERVRSACSASDTTLILSRLTRTEMASALGRKLRDRVLPPEVCEAFWTVFLGDSVIAYQTLEMDEAVLARAESLLFVHNLRAGDAIQVATAIIAAGALGARTEFEFWTADRRQAEAARAEGLTVVALR